MIPVAILMGVMLVAFCILPFVATFKEHAFERSLHDNNYTVVDSYGSFTTLWYVIGVKDCRFQVTAAADNRLIAYESEKSPKEDTSTVVYQGSTALVGPAITGYTPASFKSSAQYRACLR
jgi:hypothetical protein